MRALNRSPARRPTRRPDRRPERVAAAIGASAPGPVTFPTTPLVGRVRIALGADLSADPLTWAWQDITAKVRFDLGISATTGRRDEASVVTTGSGQMKLDNRDSRFTRRNPTGPYFGLLSKNTPIWAEVDAGSGWKTRMEMFVNEWPKTWSDKSATDSTVTIACAGVLRRLAQGRVLKSALTRAILATSPVAFWPLEDGPDATTAASGLARDSAMQPSGTVTFGAANTGIEGAEQVADLTSGMLTGTVTGASSTSWHLEYVFRHNAFRASSNFIVETTGTAFFQWIFFPPRFAGDGWTVTAVASDGITTTAALLGSSVAAASWVGQWYHVALTAEQVGANVVSRLYVNGVLEATDTTAGTLGAPVKVLANSQYAYSIDAGIGVAMSTIAIGNGTTVSNGASAVDGFAGEMAHERIARLCREEGVVYESAAGESPLMGPQGIDSLINLLREAEAVGGGVLYEKRWGLAYQSLGERYNAPVAMALDIAQHHLGEIPTPADDDQRTRNRWTAQRSNGSEFVAEQDSGPMGTGAQGPGVYDDSGTFNVQTDAQLASQAGWRVHLGTIDEDRWPDLALNFTRTPGLIDTWTGLFYGARLTIANPVAQMAVDPPDLVIEGIAERWDSKVWTAVLNCSPASAYRVYVVASTDGNLGRVDAASSYLAADATAGDTTISVASPNALWRTGAVSFDINVAGERMTVTNISGGSSPQTFTVTRAVNGVSKAQPATVGGFNTKVSLWKPGVYAL